MGKVILGEVIFTTSLVLLWVSKAVIMLISLNILCKIAGAACELIALVKSKKKD